MTGCENVQQQLLLLPYCTGEGDSCCSSSRCGIVGGLKLDRQFGISLYYMPCSYSYEHTGTVYIIIVLGELVGKEPYEKA